MERTCSPLNIWVPSTLRRSWASSTVTGDEKCDTDWRLNRNSLLLVLWVKVPRSLSPEVQQRTRLDSSSVKGFKPMQGVKLLALRQRLPLEYSFPSLGLPFFEAEGLPQAPGVFPSRAGRQREEKGTSARVAGTPFWDSSVPRGEVIAIGTKRSVGREQGRGLCLPSCCVSPGLSKKMSRRASGALFLKQILLCRWNGWRGSGGIAARSPSPLSSVSSSCGCEGSTHFRAHERTSDSFPVPRLLHPESLAGDHNLDFQS